MKLKRIYTSAKNEERDNFAIMLANAIEARHQRMTLARKSKYILVHGRLIVERRRHQIAHFLNDRRQPALWQRVVHLTLYGFMLLTITVSVYLIAINIPVNLAAPLIFSYDLALLVILFFKPLAARATDTEKKNGDFIIYNLLPKRSEVQILSPRQKSHIGLRLWRRYVKERKK